MPAILRILVVVTFSTFAILTVDAEVPKITIGPDLLGPLVHQEMKTNRLNAVVLGVWVDGEQKMLEAFGDSMTDVPATPDMHFRAGGVTLTSLCMILLKLQEEGALHLDDPISKWRPDLPKAEKVTLRMLANCTAGYPDYVPVESFIMAFHANVFREWKDEELISIAMRQPFPHEPGEGWNYSHTNFIILGSILEKIAGKRLPELFAEKLFAPLGVTHSVFAMNPAIASPVLHAYVAERGVYEDSTFWNPSWAGASGRMVSTVADVGRIAMALAGPGLLSEASRSELIALTTVGLGSNSKERYYGLGVGVVGGWIVQNPNMNGFHTLVATRPDNAVTIVITSTTDLDFDYEGGPAPSTLLFRKIAEKIAPDYPVPASFR